VILGCADVAENKDGHIVCEYVHEKKGDRPEVESLFPRSYRKQRS
jgi:hypothetical protein